MLTFIGFGLAGEKGLTKEASEVLEKSDIVYLEAYTSPIPNNVQRTLNAQEASRTFVEDGRKILAEASKLNVVLLCYGDPMVATTHMELRIRAERQNIKTRVIHNASIYSAIAGETGLHSYKFGRTITMTRAAPAKNLYVYHSIYANLLNGLHTLILLEYDKSSNFFFEPSVAIKSLLETEDEQKKLVIPKDCYMIICSRIGQNDQRILANTAENLSRKIFGKPPHAIIVTGELHYTEEEALKVLCKKSKNPIINNSARVRMPAVEMVTKYVAKTKKALQHARLQVEQKGRKFDDLFENVELYTLDAERFLNEGRHDLAILSVGYAEGLLDALNFTNDLKVEW
ncbi:MAG: diphthine synthase [Thaumarchaeota archaeon]|nr:diphthine synthase [Nitrososphaerota archaeon]